MDYQTLVTFDNFYKKMNSHKRLQNELLDFIDYVYRVDDDIKQNYLKRAELQSLLRLPQYLRQRLASIVYKTATKNSGTTYNTSKIIIDTQGYMAIVREHLLSANIGERDTFPFSMTCDLILYINKHTSIDGANFTKTSTHEQLSSMIITVKFYDFIVLYHPECVLKSLELSSALSEKMRAQCFVL